MYVLMSQSVTLEPRCAFLYILCMKKQIYFTIIGIGALLAIIGFIPGGMSGIWGILIAGITAVVYYFNKKNEEKVQERLENEGNNFTQGASKNSKPPEIAEDTPESSASEEKPSDGDTE